MSNEGNSVTGSDWPFENPPNTAAITTAQVLQGARILAVWHDSDDGSFQFLDRDFPDEKDGRIVGLGNILGRDPSVAEVADLPEGWVARRLSENHPWTRSPFLPREED
jgi:hypothetical protein